MKKNIKESIQYYRENPMEWLEDFFPDMEFTPLQKKIFEKYCKEYSGIDSQGKAYKLLCTRGDQSKYCFEYTIAAMLYTSTIGGKGSNEVEINGFKCNI